VKKAILHNLDEIDDHTALMKRLKEKARNGYQMIRFPRAASTITHHTFGRHVNQGPHASQTYSMLGACSFADMPFTWGAAHDSVLSFPVDVEPSDPKFRETLKEARSPHGKDSWVTTFNTLPEEKEAYRKDRLTFQVIRNPYDWLTSIYNWNQGPFKRSKRLLPDNFDHFVRHYLGQERTDWVFKMNNCFPYPMMKRCFFQAFDNDDNCKVDAFIRFEYLNEGISSLFQLGGLEPLKEGTLDRLKSKITKWSTNNTFNDYRDEFYTVPKTKEIVAKAYAWDLENFNYDFDGPKDKVSTFINGEE